MVHTLSVVIVCPAMRRSFEVPHGGVVRAANFLKRLQSIVFFVFGQPEATEILNLTTDLYYVSYVCVYPFVQRRLTGGPTDVASDRLISDIILPPIALLHFINRNLHERFLVLQKGPNYPYNTLKQAAEDGAVTMAWG